MASNEPVGDNRGNALRLRANWWARPRGRSALPFFSSGSVISIFLPDALRRTGFIAGWLAWVRSCGSFRCCFVPENLTLPSQRQGGGRQEACRPEAAG